MVRYYLFILIIGSSLGQVADELENLYTQKGRFRIQPSNVYNSKGNWYSDNNTPYTGKLEIYSNKLKDYRVAECSIADGLKNGIFIQYSSNKEKLPGIVGLFVNNKKEGTWTRMEPDINYQNQSWEDSKLQLITSIDYRDGIKHGSTIIHRASLERYGYIHQPRKDIIFQGQYSNGEKTGEWYYSDYTKEITGMTFYWSRKQIYKNNNLIESKCREPWGKNVDCEKYEQDNLGKIYLLSSLDKQVIKTKDPIIANKVVIKDDSGIDVEIDINEFVYHINNYHQSIVSIHRENGHYFSVDDKLRKMLNSLLESHN